MPPISAKDLGPSGFDNPHTCRWLPFLTNFSGAKPNPQGLTSPSTHQGGHLIHIGAWMPLQGSLGSPPLLLPSCLPLTFSSPSQAPLLALAPLPNPGSSVSLRWYHSEVHVSSTQLSAWRERQCKVGRLPTDRTPSSVEASCERPATAALQGPVLVLFLPWIWHTRIPVPSSTFHKTVQFWISLSFLVSVILKADMHPKGNSPGARCLVQEMVLSLYAFGRGPEQGFRL